MAGIKISVLDKGYVRLRERMGNDYTPADVARVSFDRKAADFPAEKNESLINYLIRNKEYSCFRHNVLSFEIYMPLMVARQIYKYAIASSFKEDQHGWNESSRRYITEQPEFYIPEHNQWRTAPDNKKQGSGEPLPDSMGREFTELLMKHIDKSVEIYDAAIEQNIAVEQARVFLPAYGMYVRCYWTASLNALFHFLEERLAGNAQSEIRDYAEAIEGIIEDEFPIIYHAWKDNK